jgi:hypothetical protein
MKRRCNAPGKRVAPEKAIRVVPTPTAGTMFARIGWAGQGGAIQNCLFQPGSGKKIIDK